MEKQFIEQLISNGLSIKKIKGIVEKLDDDDKPNHDLNKTTIANTCGLRLIKCGSCNKKFYEDKFMLNRLNKRYRSCIDCVMRQRSYRQKQDNTINNDINLKNENKGNDKILAILDKEYNEETNNDNDNNNNNNNNNNNIYPFPYPIEKQKNIIEKDIIVKPSNDKPKTKSKKKINNNNNYSILEPETEPEEFKLRLFNLFN